MKLTTAEWANVQDRLLATDETDALILERHIEARTYGKRWSQVVAIGLHRRDQALVEQALKEIADARSDATKHP